MALKGVLLDTNAYSAFKRGQPEALEIVRRVDNPSVKLQYDIYHAQMTEGNLIHTFSKCLFEIGHMQLADVPGRHEPGTGEINFPTVLKALDDLNYSGYMGLEYRPSGDTNGSLAWLPLDQRTQATGALQ